MVIDFQTVQRLYRFYAARQKHSEASKYTLRRSLSWCRANPLRLSSVDNDGRRLHWRHVRVGHGCHSSRQASTEGHISDVRRQGPTVTHCDDGVTLTAVEIMSGQ